MTRRALVGAVPLGLGGLAAWAWGRKGRPSSDDVQALYAEPLDAPAGALRVFHLGHSLVGREMPAMVAQLAQAAGFVGHGYEAQLGWGTSLREHWEPELTISGFEEENAHPRFRPAREAVASGDYDAVILTEMVEIKDAIRYHQSAEYLARWARAAEDGHSGTRIYLYESWNEVESASNWLARLDEDLGAHWEGEILLPAMIRNELHPAIHVIPVGQVFAHFVRRLQAEGGGNVAGLFARTPEGEMDPIHVNEIGLYLVALTHFAVLYHQSPVGLPYALRASDGSSAQAPSEQVARWMQESVWSVVTRYSKTGVLA